MNTYRVEININPVAVYYNRGTWFVFYPCWYYTV